MKTASRSLGLSVLDSCVCRLADGWFVMGWRFSCLVAVVWLFVASDSGFAVDGQTRPAAK